MFRINHKIRPIMVKVMISIMITQENLFFKVAIVFFARRIKPFPMFILLVCEHLMNAGQNNKDRAKKYPALYGGRWR